MQMNDLNLTELSHEEMVDVDGGLLAGLVFVGVLLYATDAW